MAPSAVIEKREGFILQDRLEHPGVWTLVLKGGSADEIG